MVKSFLGWGPWGIELSASSIIMRRWLTTSLDVSCMLTTNNKVCWVLEATNDRRSSVMLVYDVTVDNLCTTSCVRSEYTSSRRRMSSSVGEEGEG